VVVLSNNDGCAVTRSQKTKAVGIPMGEPWFKLAPRAKELQVRGVIQTSAIRSECRPLANTRVRKGDLPAH
jgi:hypothetical protein